MFAYNAGGVTDRSGELIAQGANNAAMLQMEAMGNVGENIGSALTMFADAYKQKEQDKSDAKIYGNLLKFIAPAFGQQGDAILAEYNALENDRDKANYGRTAASLIGPASNAMMAQGRLGLQQQGQQIQQNAPFIDAGLQGARDRASGNQTFTGAPPPDQDPANTVPLPQKNDPVTAGPATGATPQAVRPLGAGAQRMTREDWEKMRADTMRLGNPDPGPYPGP